MAAACRPKSRPRATAPRPALLSPQRVCYLPELRVGEAVGAEEIRHARTLELRIAHASGFVPDQIALAQRGGRVVNPVLRRPAPEFDRQITHVRGGGRRRIGDDDAKLDALVSLVALVTDGKTIHVRADGRIPAGAGKDGRQENRARVLDSA